ncbi:MAG: sulfatase-like hydrolase/transferase [Chitinophagaceae bacterium]|nr:sulfatase-like hydrolase/transferase [Chitinophagaceae bacterium]MCW5914073.1 sulfatase-like hydrolase/transferase [Chitinophagaceae bacterium]MCZ2396054.1 LTA synthase family protein [Chitinophagales bacterium]
MKVDTKIQENTLLIVRWIFNLWLIFMSIFSVLRIATLILFMPEGTKVSEVIPAFSLGFIYDMRWVAIILMPIALVSLIPGFSPFVSLRNKKGWSYYLAFCALFVLFFYGADFGNFSYNRTRLNASALNFAEDPVISMKMLWQSYPMVWILLALFLTVYLLSKLFGRTHIVTLKKTNGVRTARSNTWYGLTVFILGWSIYGLFSFTPLKWKDAFELNNNFTAYLALNPLQNFFSTLQFRKPDFNNEKAFEYYPIIKKFLNLPEDNQSGITYQRLVSPNSKAIESHPNIVLVICESFSMYKSSLADNPLNTTPYFKSLTENGIFFNRCFTPTFGTARGVFAIITGIPDVQLSKFSTRNPQAIDQHTIINDFEDYDKFYFIGGSSNFNNFEGLIKNIDGVKIYQEGSYKTPEVNVWGISDKSLFLESADILSEQQKPFFAIIQTADNHRPFTIPEEDTDFQKKIVPEDTLRKYGFESLKEYHAFCYTDYCIKKFMEYAKTKPWFSNTIFAFIGDHGVAGNTTSVYKAPYANLGKLADEHVPLLFYAPDLLTPQIRTETVSQIDVLPTIAGMLHQPYINSTLGRDLLNTNNKTDAAFIIHHDEGKIGVVNDRFFFTQNLQINKRELYPINQKGMEASAAEKDSASKALSELTVAIYETSKYMLLHNQKSTIRRNHK